MQILLIGMILMCCTLKITLPKYFWRENIFLTNPDQSAENPRYFIKGFECFRWNGDYPRGARRSGVERCNFASDRESGVRHELVKTERTKGSS